MTVADLIARLRTMPPTARIDVVSIAGQKEPVGAIYFTFQRGDVVHSTPGTVYLEIEDMR